MITIDFTYQSRLGTFFHAQVECLDFDQTGDIITSMIDWCESNGFRMRRCDINERSKEQ